MIQKHSYYSYCQTFSLLTLPYHINRIITFWVVFQLHKTLSEDLIRPTSVSWLYDFEVHYHTKENANE